MVDFLAAGEPVYASPSGNGIGTQENPTNLVNALASGRDIFMMDGIYQIDDDVIVGATMQAISGTRPIITRTDNKPPRIHLNAGVVLNGIWFGGTKETVTERPITTNDGVVIRNCTFFGYYGGVVEGGNTDHQFINNRFVNCGTGLYYHDFYISNNHAADGCLIQGNIHIGGGGYKSHLYNGVNSLYPSNVQLLNNFYGDVQWGAAVYGQGHTLQDNVFWSDVGSGGTNITANLNASATFSFNHNAVGLNTSRIFYASNPGQSADSNAIVDGCPTDLYGDSLGTNLAVWQEANVVSNLGNSSANIDAAIAALETAFGQTVQQIHDDATIEGHFTTLKNVVDTWKLAA